MLPTRRNSGAMRARRDMTRRDCTGRGRSPAAACHGFTLIEIMVSLAVVTLMAALLYPGFGYAVRFVQRVQTQARLRTLETAVTQAYSANAINVDGFGGAGTVYFPTGGTAYGYPFTTGAAATLSPSGTWVFQPGFVYLSQHYGEAAEDYALDAFHKPLEVFVSNTLYATWSGYPVYYHVLAFVSSDGRARFDPGTTFNPTTGKLTLGGHDLGVVISGLSIETGLYEQTLQTMREIASAYGAYFTSLYLNSVNRDPSVDYFSQPPPGFPAPSEFDITSAIANSCGLCGGWAYAGDPYPGEIGVAQTDLSQMLQDCQPAPNLSGFAATLGFGAGAMSSAFGFPLAVCNGPNADGHGDNVRNPAASGVALQDPPFTAFIEAWASDRVVLAVPIVGEY